MQRVGVEISGGVQGVGFRPFVYRLATELGLRGWVSNSAGGVLIEAEGEATPLESFVRRLRTEPPPRAFVRKMRVRALEPCGSAAFEIRASLQGKKSAFILPDIATCADCLRELFDPQDRRHRYPFTNCTSCGPRFSIVESLPYDRATTSMRRFPLCGRCRAEYEDPLDRRFHAEPNACPQCGPHLELWDPSGAVLELGDAALLGAAQALRSGAIVALKGLGGFHLMTDARCEAALARLRLRKGREEKPFAVMFPSLGAVGRVCEVTVLEAELLLSAAAPIVLLRRLREPQDVPLAGAVAPGNPNVGAFLPYTPLHHLLLAELGFALVATSGNRSDEPICTDEREALSRLEGIADVLLVHDRPIVRPVDDSVVRVMAGRAMPLRRARGYAPFPVEAASPLAPVLAVGAHLKNASAIAVGQSVFVGQHVGDLDTPEAVEAFGRAVRDLQRLYDFEPGTIACDLHPDYASSLYASQSGLPLVRVQHHVAHVLSCMADNGLDGPVLGVAWDGTGLGLDGTVWGGELFRIEGAKAERVAHLRPFPLPGGDRAAREPRRSALGLLYELNGGAEGAGEAVLAGLFSAHERAALGSMLGRGVGSPYCSSAGRLFDAVAALAGLRSRCSFEGQAAMELELALGPDAADEPAYPIGYDVRGGAAIIDWGPMLQALLEDIEADAPPPVARIAARFHNALCEAIVELARRVGERRVVLSGGCFQNRYLSERTIGALRAAGFQPYWHRNVPPNDGGIALGQIVAATRGEAPG
jgi:hydrogenase maturation protein HypF